MPSRENRFLSHAEHFGAKRLKRMFFKEPLCHEGSQAHDVRCIISHISPRLNLIVTSGNFICRSQFNYLSFLTLIFNICLGKSVWSFVGALLCICRRVTRSREWKMKFHQGAAEDLRQPCWAEHKPTIKHTFLPDKKRLMRRFILLFIFARVAAIRHLSSLLSCPLRPLAPLG